MSRCQDNQFRNGANIQGSANDQRRQASAALDGALADVEARLAREQEVLASRERAGQRLLALGEMVNDLPNRLLTADPLVANRWLRELVETVVVTDKQVTEVRLLL
ncbi:MAG: hypothetical protein KC519_11190 [Anaerolineae bacterium]|nr:hypothetical protein [Anaerolineae bacterium]